MSNVEVPVEAPGIIEVVAGAIRHELGEEIDASPGCRSPEGADPINRAFRAVARSLLAASGVWAGELDAAVSRVLHRITSRWLEAEGWDDIQVKSLIEDEPGSPDDWLIFLALSSRPQIETLLDSDRT